MMFDVGAGLAHWDHLRDCTTWYECGMPYSPQPNTYTLTLGLRGDNWRAGFVDLGKPHISAIALVEDRPGHLGYASGSRSCTTTTPCANFDGSGHTQGLYALWTPKVGPVRLEMGLAALRVEWTENVSGQFTGLVPAGPIVHLTVPGYGGTFVHKPNIALSPVLGVEYEINKRFAVGANAYFNIDAKGDWIPSWARGPVATATLRARF